MIIRKFYFLIKAFFIQQWWDFNRLNKFQNLKLRFILRYAGKNVNFYHHLFNKLNLDPDKFKGIEDLKLLPIINNELVVANLPDFIAQGTAVKKCIKKDSSGSSGIPMVTYYDLQNYDYVEAIYARAFFIHQLKPWDRMAYFWYKPFEKKKLWEHLGLMKKNLILFTEPVETQIKKLISMKPTVIHCFPSTLYSIAKEVKKNSLPIRPRLIITHGETVTRQMREFLEATFHCRLLDEYGLSEFTRIAWECPQGGGYHVDDDYLIVEILKDDQTPAQPGERGMIVITSLFNLAMPLIRYATGDIGIRGPKTKCKCGREFSKILEIEGRNDDFVILPSGKLISPRQVLDSIQKDSYFNTDEFTEKIYRYKIIQKDYDKFIVFIVARRNIDETFKKEIAVRIQEALREKIEVTVQLVQDLPLTKHGKYKILISDIQKTTC
ncbi:MAG TPA: hypothetical protein PL125_02785 [Candidatus Omnitrophota bacterium]|nr:hypothetical protein [Candidatus Omnitrophota bacterium]HPT39106.1 hypothetical protein [Candidatus Omnitrophota bacterium]